MNEGEVSPLTTTRVRLHLRSRVSFSTRAAQPRVVAHDLGKGDIYTGPWNDPGSSNICALNVDRVVAGMMRCERKRASTLGELVSSNSCKLGRETVRSIGVKGSIL